MSHATPRSPQGKGKMERWFRTVRMQPMPTLDTSAPLSIDAMNRRLAACVEGEYHRAPHCGLGGATPMDRWAATSEHVRLPGSDVGDGGGGLMRLLAIANSPKEARRILAGLLTHERQVAAGALPEHVLADANHAARVSGAVASGSKSRCATLAPAAACSVDASEAP